jgi:Putative peptidoglycan binding domain
MNRFVFSAVFATAAVTGILSNTAGQVINATAQTASPRATTGRGAPAIAGKAAPQVVPRSAGINPQHFNPNLPRTIAPPPANLQRTFPAPLQTSNAVFAALNVQPNGTMQQPITVDPAMRQTELRTLAAMRQRRGIVTREGNILDPATRQNEIHTLAAIREKRGVAPGQQANIADASTRETELRTIERMRERGTGGTDNNQTLASIDPQRHVTNRGPETGPQRDNPESPKESHGKKGHKKDRGSFNETFGRHWHEWHDRNWWHDHCQTIVFVNTGYYFLDGSYWYPAYGYDPMQTYYDYDGPVYTYSNLLPDEVIANVQTALQNAGYFYGPITGSLSVDTRAAIANFQRDYGLEITGAIDEDTVATLGLY